jgi:hypothetical protein
MVGVTFPIDSPGMDRDHCESSLGRHPQRSQSKVLVAAASVARSHVVGEILVSLVIVFKTCLCAKAVQARSLFRKSWWTEERRLLLFLLPIASRCCGEGNNEEVTPVSGWKLRSAQPCLLLHEKCCS